MPHLGPTDLPPSLASRISDLARAVDHLLGTDPIGALAVAREEYALYLEAERASRRRLHKGHPLHNIGVAIHASDHEEGRTYFHAAHIEDARTYPNGSSEHGWLARRMLLELYGERLSIIEQLEALAHASHDEPVAVARRFAAQHGPFEAFHGLRESWRDEDELDALDPTRLVFCGGSRALPMGFKALKAGVDAAGLHPVVVMEFKDQPGETAYLKSLRLLDRCRLAAFDVSDPSGQIPEMTAAERSGMRLFAGFISNDPLDRLHGSSMYPGLVAAAGAKPRACRGYDEMEAEVRDWCVAQAVSIGLGRDATRLSPLESKASSVLGSNFHAAGSAAADVEIVPSGSDAAAYFAEEFEIPDYAGLLHRSVLRTAGVPSFDRDGLTAAGFTGWTTVDDLTGDTSRIPAAGGTYVVLRAGDVPRVLVANPGGRFKGRDPTVPTSLLEARLDPDARVLYIGQGSSLRKRIRQLTQFAAGKPVGHWGGRCLWQLEGSGEFLVAWRAESDPRSAESVLLSHFETRYGRLPFANWRR